MLAVALRSGRTQITAICIVATCQNLKSTPAPIGGSARVSREQGRSQKATLNWAALVVARSCRLRQSRF
jgi:hypothetical protein